MSEQWCTFECSECGEVEDIDLNAVIPGLRLACQACSGNHEMIDTDAVLET
jgi:transposase